MLQSSVNTNLESSEQDRQYLKLLGPTLESKNGSETLLRILSTNTVIHRIDGLCSVSVSEVENIDNLQCYIVASSSHLHFLLCSETASWNAELSKLYIQWDSVLARLTALPAATLPPVSVCTRGEVTVQDVARMEQHR